VLRRCTALGNFPAAAADDMHGDPPGPISQAICGSTDSYVILPLPGRQVTGAGHRCDVTILPAARNTTDSRRSLPFVPAEVGTQGPKALAERLGPHSRGDERREGLPKNTVAPASSSNSRASAAPGLIGLGVGPSLYLSPHEGSGAPRRRMAWISPDRPDLTGGPGTPGPWRISGCARVLSTRHAASTALRLHGSVGPARSLCATGGLPAAARGRGSRSPRSRVPHPAPPLRRLARTPLSGRDGDQHNHQ